MSKTLIAIALCITYLEAIALGLGYDGASLQVVIGILAGLAGYSAKSKSSPTGQPPKDKPPTG